MLLLLLLACSIEGTLAIPDCEMEPTPALGEWTESFDPDVSGSCEDNNPYGWSLYDGRVVAIDGHRADLGFRKDPAGDSDAPISTIHWELLESPDGEPACGDVDDDPALVTGEWEADLVELVVSDVAIWASPESFEAAEAGEERYVYLVTTGSDNPTTLRWWQRYPLSFLRSCPEDR